MTGLFWALALIAGYGITATVESAQSQFIQPGPASPIFMLLSLFIVMMIFQIRVNLTRPRPYNAHFVFASPDETIVGELAAYFAGSFLRLYT